MLARRSLHMRQPRLGRQLLAYGVQFAASQRVEQIALQDDALTLATGEPFVSEVFGTGLHGIARLAAEPAHGERHRFALDQTMVEPGGARRRDLGAEIDVRTGGEYERRPLVLRPAEAPNLDDATDRR